MDGTIRATKRQPPTGELIGEPKKIQGKKPLKEGLVEKPSDQELLNLIGRKLRRWKDSGFHIKKTRTPAEKKLRKKFAKDIISVMAQLEDPNATVMGDTALIRSASAFFYSGIAYLVEVRNANVLHKDWGERTAADRVRNSMAILRKSELGIARKVLDYLEEAEAAQQIAGACKSNGE